VERVLKCAQTEAERIATADDAIGLLLDSLRARLDGAHAC